MIRPTTMGAWTQVRTRWGTIGLVESERGLVTATWLDLPAEAWADQIEEWTGPLKPVRSSSTKLLLDRYFAGADVSFGDVVLDQAGRTDFQQRVTNACRDVGHGHTTTYQALAQAAGHPRAARAVGRVMATNRWLIIVPCHRVLAAGGGLGGYSGGDGIKLKEQLLRLEQRSAPTMPRRKLSKSR